MQYQAHIDIVDLLSTASDIKEEGISFLNLPIIIIIITIIIIQTLSVLIIYSKNISILYQYLYRERGFGISLSFLRIIHFPIIYSWSFLHQNQEHPQSRLYRHILYHHHRITVYNIPVAITILYSHLLLVSSLTIFLLFYSTRCTASAAQRKSFQPSDTLSRDPPDQNSIFRRRSIRQELQLTSPKGIPSGPSEEAVAINTHAEKINT